MYKKLSPNHLKLTCFISTSCAFSMLLFFCRKKRMSTGTLNFYPVDDDDSDIFSTKKSEPVEETIQKKESSQQDTAPSMRLQQRLSLKNRMVRKKFAYCSNE